MWLVAEKSWLTLWFYQGVFKNPVAIWWFLENRIMGLQSLAELELQHWIFKGFLETTWFQSYSGSPQSQSRPSFQDARRDCYLHFLGIYHGVSRNPVAIGEWIPGPGLWLISLHDQNYRKNVVFLLYLTEGFYLLFSIQVPKGFFWNAAICNIGCPNSFLAFPFLTIGTFLGNSGISMRTCQLWWKQLRSLWISAAYLSFWRCGLYNGTWVFRISYIFWWL